LERYADWTIGFDEIESEKVILMSRGEEIEKLAREHRISCDIIEDTEKEVQVEISGDWKHEHLRFELLVKNNIKIMAMSSITTKEDGSDYYTAIHTISF